MDPKKLDYHYQTIKGRCAEALIEELFIMNGYDVFRFGMENTVPGILKKIKNTAGKTADRIRKIPDLLITKDGKTFLIEVKFRSDGKFLRNRDCPADFPYRECYFVVVSKGGIKCINYGEMTAKGQEILPDNDKHMLSERKEFSLNKETVKRFESIADMIFNGVKTRIYNES